MKNLQILEDENLLAAAHRTGKVLREAAQPMVDELEVVGEIRQVGMGMALQLVTDRETRTPLPQPGVFITAVIRDETGVIARISSDTNLVLSPPLVMTEDEATRAISAVESVPRRIRADGSIA